MQGFGPIRLFCLTLIAMLTLALGVAGAAHRVPSLERATLQAYQLAGLPVELCGKGDHGAQMPACPVCTVIGAALIPPPTLGLMAEERLARAAIYLPLIAQSRHKPRDPTTPLRGPPGFPPAGQIA